VIAVLARGDGKMSSIHTLQTRLKDVSASLNEISPLINRLKDFTLAIGQGDEARLELGTEIHSRLKEAEEDMELLKEEVEILEGAGSSRRKGGENGNKGAERRRVIGLAERLTADVKRYVWIALLPEVIAPNFHLRL
jgi:hypothetical protein